MIIMAEHSFTSPKVVANKIREELQETLSKNADEILTLWQKLKEIDDDQGQQNEEDKQECGQITTQCEVLHSTVDGIATCGTEYQPSLEEARESLQSQLKVRTAFENKIKIILTKPNDVEVIQQSRSLTAPKPLCIPPTYSPQSLVSQVVKGEEHRMIGRSTGSPEDAEEVSDLVHPLNIQPQSSSSSTSQNLVSDSVPSLCHRKVLSLSSTLNCRMTASCIRPSSSYDQTWIKWLKLEMLDSLQLVDRDGHIIQTVKFPCVISGYRMSQDHSLLVCGFEDRFIYRVQNMSEPTVYFRTPFYPLDILPLNNGDLVVSQVDSNVFLRTEDSRRMIVKLSQYGQQHIEDAEYDLFGDPLFARPVHLNTNSTNTIIAVINFISQISSHLVLLDGNLNLQRRFINIGNVIPANQKYKRDVNEKFFVLDMTFDSSDNIILLEQYSKSIFLLNSQCELLHTLWEDEILPTTFSMQSNGEIWCQFSQKRIIKILK